MKKNRAGVLLIVVTVLALGAGLVAGLLASRLPSTPAPVAEERSPLVEELNLSPEQAKQMRQIWEGVRESVRGTFDDAQKLQKDRDAALIALLNDEQKARFEKISQDYAAQFTQLTQNREAMFQDAVARTNKILDERQRQKYAQILQRHAGPGRGGHDPEMLPPPPVPPGPQP